MLLSLRGTPLIYQGEEIGMSNFPFTNISQYDDIGVHNLWKDLVETGKVSAAEYLLEQRAHQPRQQPHAQQWDAIPNSALRRRQSRGWL